MSIFKDQGDFMSAAGQCTNGTGTFDNNSQQSRMYAALVAEEAKEFAETQEDGFSTHSYSDDIKEAVDLIVVAAGYLISELGVEGAQKAWNAVHESNLSKLVGGVEKRADGKVLKNEQYKNEAKDKLMAYLDLLATSSYEPV